MCRVSSSFSRYCYFYILVWVYTRFWLWSLCCRLTSCLTFPVAKILNFKHFKHFLVLCPDLLVGDWTFLVVYTSQNSKYVPYPLSLTKIREMFFLTSNLWTIMQLMHKIVCSLECEWSMSLKRVEKLCVKYIHANRQISINNYMNSEVNFQKKHIPVLTLYSNFLHEGCTIPELGILWNFAEWSVELIEMFIGGGG